MSFVKLSNGTLDAAVFDGQLVSLEFNGRQYFHGGGLPEDKKTSEDKTAWGNSEIVMFPVVGPVKDDLVDVGNARLIQHGIARALPFNQTSLIAGKGTIEGISLLQAYNGETVPNPKGTGKLNWPFNYKLAKRLRIIDDKLHAYFTLRNVSEQSMPYMFGWHPAFVSSGNGTFQFDGSKRQPNVTLEEIAKEEGNAVLLEGVDDVKFLDMDGTGIDMKTAGFSNVMIWTPDQRVYCVEPVTRLPVLEKGKQGYFASDGDFRFLKPGREDAFNVVVRLY